MGRSAVLALVLFPCTASAAPVPQPGALSAAVRGLNLPTMGGGRLSRTRFPLFFAVDRHHGSFMSPDTAVFYGVSGHGPTTRRYRSVSLEVLFRGVKPVETNLPTTGRLIAGIGLSDEVGATAEAMLRAAVARADSLRIHGGYKFGANLADVREAGGIQVRLEGHFYGGTSMGAFVILQFTDADVPEASWPSPGEIEKLQPPHAGAARRLQRHRDLRADRGDRPSLPARRARRLPLQLRVRRRRRSRGPLRGRPVHRPLPKSRRRQVEDGARHVTRLST